MQIILNFKCSFPLITLANSNLMVPIALVYLRKPNRIGKLIKYILESRIGKTIFDYDFVNGSIISRYIPQDPSFLRLCKTCTTQGLGLLRTNPLTKRSKFAFSTERAHSIMWKIRQLQTWN